MIVLEKDKANKMLCPFKVMGENTFCVSSDCVAWQNMELKKDNTYKATSKNEDKGICLRLASK